MIIIGIDPGITGAVAVIGNGVEKVLDIPTMAKGKGQSTVKKQINASGLKSLIVENLPKRGKVEVYLERTSAMPGQGVASMFSMGDSYGCIRGVCAALELRLEVITPASWKKHFGLGRDKEVVRAKAIELFPDMPLSRKKDHNRAEALLIAKYGWDKES